MTAEREGLVDALSAEIWKHTGETCSLECGDGFGYHDVESVADRRRGVAHLADALADLLAARDRRVRAEALREAAGDCDRQVLAAPFSLASLGPWLRDRADRIEDDA